MTQKTQVIAYNAPTNDLQSLLMKYWIAKTISYCPDSRLKGQSTYLNFISSLEKVLQTHKDWVIRFPSRPVFYLHIKEAFYKGLIGADYVVNKEEGYEFMPREIRVNRRTDGIYFEDLYLNLNRLSSPDFPVLLKNSSRADLLIRARQTGIEKLFITPSKIAEPKKNKLNELYLQI